VRANQKRKPRVPVSQRDESGTTHPTPESENSTRTVPEVSPLSGVLHESGRPLDAETRIELERQVGYDFSKVRIHDNRRADRAARSVDASAFTVGQHVVFSEGSYQPESSEGRRLLAHEAAHTVQQGSGPASRWMLASPQSFVSDPSPGAEAEADRAASEVMAEPDTSSRPRVTPMSVSMPDTSAVVQRQRRAPTAPTAHVGGAHVGGEPGNWTFLTDPSGATLAPGDHGYSGAMLDALPDAADALAGNYESMLLRDVAPSFGGLQQQIETRGREVAKFEQLMEGNWWEPRPAVVVRMYREAKDWSERHMKTIQDDRWKQEQRFAAFNAWVPGANDFYTSLTRLDAMQDMLGVSDPRAMASALVTGLRDAGQVAARFQLGAAGNTSVANPNATLDVPPADRSLVQMFNEAIQVAQEMNTAWLGFHQTILSERAADVDAQGDLTRQQLEQIDKTKETIRSIGSTIDTTMSVVRGAQAGIANARQVMAHGEAQLNAFRNQRRIIRGERPLHNPTYLTSNEEGEMVVRNVQTGTDRTFRTQDDGSVHIQRGPAGAGPSIGMPSVGGALGALTDFIYYDEVRQLNRTLDEIQAEVNSLQASGKKMEMLRLTNTFRDAVNNFARVVNNLPQRMAERRQAYWKFGLQLDQYARQDPQSRTSGQSPGRNEERYATIMVAASAVREVLAIGNGSTQGIFSPTEFITWARAVRSNRRGTRPPRRDITTFDLSEDEAIALVQVYTQLNNFNHNVGQLNEIFGPVESAASGLMQQVHRGGGSGAY
jgi:hypothetical protein